MKAKELMFGDWVYDTEDERTYRVDGALFEFCREWDKIQPIPLTAEMLEKNGFTLHGKTYVLELNGAEIRWRRTDGYTSITAPSNLKIGGFCSIANGYFCFVHFLQHALRLCGLNDLADNFKVE